VGAVGPTDCIVEGEILKLGGVLQSWQKKHLKLYPNRFEFYPKNRDGHVAKGKGVEVCFRYDIGMQLEAVYGQLTLLYFLQVWNKYNYFEL